VGRRGRVFTLASVLAVERKPPDLLGCWLLAFVFVAIAALSFALMLQVG
jgi:hypothetical protein